MITIVIRKRGGEDFEAFLQGEASVVGRGTTSDAAVGDLVRSHGDRFSITVVAASKAPVSARVSVSPGLIRT